MILGAGLSEKKSLAESAEDAEFVFFFLIRFSEGENLTSEFL